MKPFLILALGFTFFVTHLKAQDAVNLKLKSSEYATGELVSKIERVELERKKNETTINITSKEIIVDGAFSDKCLVKTIQHDKAERLYDIVCEDGRKMFYDYYVQDFKSFGIEFEYVNDHPTKYIHFNIQ